MRKPLDHDRIQHFSRPPEMSGFRTPEARVQAKTESAELLLPPENPQPDEILIVDARAGLRPAQVVEHKLISLLKSVYLPVSHVRTTSLCTGRPHFSASSPEPERAVRNRGRTQ